MNNRRPYRYAKSSLALTLLCVVSASLTACNRAEAARDHAQSRRDDSPNVVSFGSETLSLAQIEAPVAHQLFELRSATAQDLIVSALLEQEAARRKLSLADYIKLELEQKLPVPTEEELTRAYDFEREHDVTGTLPSFAELKPRLLEQLQGAARQRRQQEISSQLLAKADVRMNLDAMGRPKHRTRSGGPARGPENARITIVEYADFTSPFCAMAQQTVEKLLQSYPRDVRVVFRQKPEPGQPLALAAAQAALCAEEQGRYWDYRKLLFAAQKGLTEPRLREFAARLSLDQADFERCLASGEKAEIVKSDAAEAQSQNLEGSPVFSVNGTRLSGAHPYETFVRLIELDLPERRAGAR